MNGPGDRDISYAEALLLGDPVFIDVRSPDEFAADHIPGSINIPLFSDEERKEIGIMYRHTGREEAVILGTGFVGGKISDLVSRIGSMAGRDIVILCARGGMRSSSLASLLNSLGIRVFRIRHGYKEYRKHVFERMKQLTVKPPLFVLQGLTGAGKTEILGFMENSIDLEGIAGHRSSVFGGIGMASNTQKWFESLLLERAGKLEGCRYVAIEGESRKIGDIHIPQALFRQMREAPCIFIKTTIERRAEIIMKEYTKKADPSEVIPIIKGLAGRLGEKNAAGLIRLIETGKTMDFVIMLLETYYDPLYRYSFKKMKFIAEIENLDSGKAAAEAGAIIEKHLDTD
ncbi:MAG: tRNA 2-selenouridine(34) synthase MnmH [Spirochaetes bacterium]|nr:tRNA 2-selenouridine(34) synthase MnmH [Spirochaetota bacterium]